MDVLEGLAWPSARDVGDVPRTLLAVVPSVLAAATRLWQRQAFSRMLVALQNMLEA